MKYIGGQTHIQCQVHKLPLIVFCKSEKQCYQQMGELQSVCGNIMYLEFPELMCKSGLCQICYHSENYECLMFIVPPNQGMDENDYSSDETYSYTDSDLIEETEDSDSISNSFYGNISDSSEHTNNDDILENEEDGKYYFVISAGVDDDYLCDIHAENITTTIFGNKPFEVQEKLSKVHYVSGHVVMNQCGYLLNRNEVDIYGFRSQRYVLHRIESICEGNTLPLLYPEAMLFPSIFWSMVPNNGSICGAIPSGLLVKANKHGFASMKNHVRSRL